MRRRSYQWDEEHNRPAPIPRSRQVDWWLEVHARVPGRFSANEIQIGRNLAWYSGFSDASVLEAAEAIHRERAMRRTP
jgi:hypothetical protein